MPKSPQKFWYMQWCTREWLGDPLVSQCSPATRGIWKDLIDAMHEDGRSGELRGTTDQLARVARCSTAEFSAAMNELQTTRAADLHERNGTWLIRNRRMYREDQERKSNARRQKEFRDRHASRESNGNVATDSKKSKVIPPNPQRGRRGGKTKIDAEIENALGGSS